MVSGSLRTLLLLCLMALAFEATAQQSLSQGPKQCADEATAAAADSLAKQFDQHQFIFIGSTHGDLKIEQFLMCLVSRPAFTQRVTDIIAEQISSAHQKLLDRYLLALDDVSSDSLTPIWFDTDAPTMWTTLPQVHRFLDNLREVNGTLPRTKRIRLVGGNEGIDWQKVKVPEDLAPFPYKTNLMPHLLIEHLAKEPGNRTLVIYGDCHIHWRGNNFMHELDSGLGREKLYVVGRINDLAPAERKFLMAVGNPEQPFFVTADRFPTSMDGPASLLVCTGETAGPLSNYIDAFV